jgi:hypothetical protein
MIEPLRDLMEGNFNLELLLPSSILDLFRLEFSFKQFGIDLVSYYCGFSIETEFKPRWKDLIKLV